MTVGVVEGAMRAVEAREAVEMMAVLSVGLRVTVAVAVSAAGSEGAEAFDTGGVASRTSVRSLSSTCFSGSAGKEEDVGDGGLREAVV